MKESESVSCSVMSESAISWTAAARLLCPWNSPCKNTGVGPMPFFWGSSWTKDWTHVSCIGRQILYHWVSREALFSLLILGKAFEKFLMWGYILLWLRLILSGDGRAHKDSPECFSQTAVTCVPSFKPPRRLQSGAVLPIYWETTVSGKRTVPTLNSIRTGSCLWWWLLGLPREISNSRLGTFQYGIWKLARRV